MPSPKSAIWNPGCYSDRGADGGRSWEWATSAPRTNCRTMRGEEVAEGRSAADSATATDNQGGQGGADQEERGGFGHCRHQETLNLPAREERAMHVHWRLAICAGPRPNAGTGQDFSGHLLGNSVR